MSQQLVIDGKIYLPSSILARQFSYTSDYLAKLAREEKVDATRVGRQWYITETSLQQFVSEAQESKAKRSEELREERRLEREHHEVATVTASSEVITTTTTTLSPAAAAPVTPALLQTLLVVVCGLALGTTGYYAYQVSNELTQYDEMVTGQQTAALDYSVVWRWLFGSTEVVVIDPAVPAPSQEKLPPTDYSVQNAMLMLDGETSTATAKAIQESFSDEVGVTFDGPNTVIIQPIFKEKTDESYRSFLAPVTETQTR